MHKKALIFIKEAHPEAIRKNSADKLIFMKAVFTNWRIFGFILPLYKCE